MPVRIKITAGTVHDIKEGEYLIKGITADFLLGDKGYDSDKFIEIAEQAGMITVIPPRRNKKNQRFYDKDLYKLRHLVENAFLHLKRWRGVATRYAKNTLSFLAAVQIRCIALWARVLA
jgi:transposase